MSSYRGRVEIGNRLLSCARTKQRLRGGSRVLAGKGRAHQQVDSCGEEKKLVYFVSVLMPYTTGLPTLALNVPYSDDAALPGAWWRPAFVANYQKCEVDMSVSSTRLGIYANGF